MRFVAQVAVACAIMALGVAPVRAAANTEAQSSARLHFQKGEAHYSAGRFAEALTEYQAGYDVRPLPGFLVNIAQCHRRLGDLKRARASYEKFVWVAPDSPLVPEVRLQIAEVDRLTSEGEGEGEGESESEGAEARQENEREPDTGVSLVPTAAPPKAGHPRADIALPESAVPSPSTTTGAKATPRRWWLWGTIGVAVLGGTVAAIALSATPDAMTIHEGTLGTLRR